jgi:hypothetical protein
MFGRNNWKHLTVDVAKFQKAKATHKLQPRKPIQQVVAIIAYAGVQVSCKISSDGWHEARVANSMEDSPLEKLVQKLATFYANRISILCTRARHFVPILPHESRSHPSIL